MTRIGWIFFVLATTLLAAAGYFALRREPPPQLDFIVADAEQDLGEVQLGVHEVTVQLSNPSEQPRRVIGMAELCAGTYCFMMRHPSDTTVRAGETCLYKYDLLIKKPGPFNAKATLFLEGNGLQEVPLKIHGIAVAPDRKGSGRATPAS